MFRPLSNAVHGGPGRPRTYDNPVMSRGLYQLSYGSNSRNMPPFPPFGKKKDTPRGNFRSCEKIAGMRIFRAPARRKRWTGRIRRPPLPPPAAPPRVFLLVRKPYGFRSDRLSRAQSGEPPSEQEGSALTGLKSSALRPYRGHGRSLPVSAGYAVRTKRDAPSASRRSALRSARRSPQKRPQKKAPSPEGKRALFPQRRAMPGSTARSPAGRPRKRCAAEQENTPFLEKRAAGAGGSPFSCGQTGTFPPTVRFSPPASFSAYSAWKYSRGCAQAGQDSGASSPSCT